MRHPFAHSRGKVGKKEFIHGETIAHEMNLKWTIIKISVDIITETIFICSNRNGKKAQKRDTRRTGARLQPIIMLTEIDK